jgi:hypothetical protein
VADGIRPGENTCLAIVQLAREVAGLIAELQDGRLVTDHHCGVVLGLSNSLVARRHSSVSARWIIDVECSR